MRERLTPLPTSMTTKMGEKDEFPVARTIRIVRRPVLFRMVRKSVLFLLLVMGLQVLVLTTATASALSPAPDSSLTNNKIFHHNRTSPALLNVRTKGPKSRPVVGSKTKSKNSSAKNPKKPQQQLSPATKIASPLKPIPNLNANNYNNYFSTAINFLNMALAPSSPLSSTTPRSSPPRPKGKVKNKAKFRPSPLAPESLPSPQPFFGAPPTLNPLSVLGTEMGRPNKTGLEGRSNFETEPLFEASHPENKTSSSGSSGLTSGKKLAANFFDKFEDHWEDPIAEESGAGTAPALVPAPYRFEKPWLTKPSVSRDPAQYGPTSFTGTGGAYDTSGTGQSGGAPSGTGSGPSHSYSDNKKPSYWPQKLNSYYGEELNSQMGPRPTPSNHYDGSKLKGRVPYPGPRPAPHYYNLVDKPSQHAHQTELDEPTAAGSETNSQKTSMIDRVSVFYTDHKLFTWALVSVIAALAALGVLLALYLSNPPTEVVTARKELSRSLENPQLLAFLTNPSLKGAQEPLSGNKKKRRRSQT